VIAPKGGGARAFVAGAASVAAFAPLGAGPLALITLAALIHLWIDATPRRALITGFWFGLGLFGAGVSWIYVSLSEFGGMPPPIAGFATVCFCAFIALFPAAAGWLQARIPGSPAVRATLLIPSAWVLFEWLKMWILSGFPWLSVGYAAVGWPLQGYAPLFGVFGLSFITVSLAGMLFCFLKSRNRHWFAAILVVLAAGQALRFVEWSTPQGAPLSVALLQGNIEQSLKFDPARYARTLETYARLADETRAKLIVFPETAVPRFLDRVDPAYLARLDGMAKRNGGDLLLGVPTRRGNDEYFNSVITLGSSPVQAYHKRHLVAFGEFMPPGFGFVLRWLDIPMSDFSRGARDQLVLDAAGQRIAPNICYEDVFGDEVARALPQATLLVNMSNMAWFGDSLAPGQHLQMARLRAVETGRMHLTATNTGVTAAIDRDGTVLARLPQFAQGRLEARAQGYTGATPYVWWADWPVVVLCVAVLGALVLVARARPSR
jgi:apolipoprotein N-acyltransferase